MDCGGTDVIVMIKQKTMAPDVLISLQGIPGLDQIQYNGSLSIGPMVTHRAIEKSEAIKKNFSALTDAADSLGSVQIRNMATIGGKHLYGCPVCRYRHSPFGFRNSGQDQKP